MFRPGSILFSSLTDTRDLELVQFANGAPATPAVGTNDDKVIFARTFINSTSLALLVVYQAVTFFLAMTRLARALIGQRSMELEGVSGSDRRYLFRGTGWIAAGVALGGVETVLGFVSDGSFGLFFTRRLLRLLGRACLVIGVAKGYVHSNRELRGIYALT